MTTHGAWLEESESPKPSSETPDHAECLCGHPFLAHEGEGNCEDCDCTKFVLTHFEEGVTEINLGDDAGGLRTYE